LASRIRACETSGCGSRVLYGRFFEEVRIMTKLMKFFREEKGVTAIEYGLIAALVAVAIIAAVTIVGDELDNTFSTVGSKLTAANQ